ncbi:hypothetical protein LTR36_004476 [Oleoguttula mirabilis]|uniref:Putative gamma-glutamylcyclotransferase n=1 Tax=Oleoguttula mirabilis TaxID=1507867 RepID=A0AAV9JH34_9PEZI|nr:hypothetical protein LTR36_004476 [Oleoguttula mirabilis]
MADHNRCAFFYGTLMAPQVLHRVCHGSSDPENPIFATHQLQAYPAILHNHRRHRVKEADYPAVRPHDGSTVRGTYVTGLTDADIWRLDVFEGSEYSREKVNVRILTQVADEGGKGNVDGEEVEAETYIWSADPADLDENEWDFAEFQREKMRFWVGAEGAGEYAEVDEAVAAEQDGTGGRGANGHITSVLLEARKNDEVVKSAV